MTPELLDELDPGDPRARRSRRDLRRVHRVMGSVRILRGLIRALRLTAAPRSIIELGAGDGTLLLRLARALGTAWTGVDLTLLDRHDLVAEKTRAAYRQMGWTVTVLRQDALAWSRPPVSEHYDLCVVNLFLHHFQDADLASVLRGCAERTDAFIACEPRRDTFGRLGSRLIGLLGANAVTRDDAVKSVDAGFSGRELGTLWAAAAGRWVTAEYAAWPFTHCFAAIRPASRSQDRHGI